MPYLRGVFAKFEQPVIFPHADSVTLISGVLMTSLL